jgi:hypothetical protein
MRTDVKTRRSPTASAARHVAVARLIAEGINTVKAISDRLDRSNEDICTSMSRLTRLGYASSPTVRARAGVHAVYALLVPLETIVEALDPEGSEDKALSARALMEAWGWRPNYALIREIEELHTP